MTRRKEIKGEADAVEVQRMKVTKEETIDRNEDRGGGRECDGDGLQNELHRTELADNAMDKNNWRKLVKDANSSH